MVKTPETSKSRAVILLAYGGPNQLEDVPDYLAQMRGGRPTPQELIDEIAGRYRLIGGRSPLLEITQKTAKKLQERVGLPVFVGMKHWSPWIQEVVSEMAGEGVDQITAICMAPHYSDLSIGKYHDQLNEAVAGAGRAVTVDFISSWNLQSDYLKGVSNEINLALERWPEEQRDRVVIIFTAHSLPAHILDEGDPYDQQLQETAEALAHKLDLPQSRWLFSYQSEVKTGVPWLGPQIEEVVAVLGREGHRDLIIAPIGFITDNVEILYDIDIGVQKIAKGNGIRLERPEMLNDSDLLVSALASLVETGSDST